MHVIAIHHIHDPAGFQKAAAEAKTKELPPGLKLPIHAETNDYTKAVCIWEGPSVEAVRNQVESVVGTYSKNDYFEMTVQGL